MSQVVTKVKLPYYPGVLAYQSATSTGVLEITTPDIYNKPLPNNKYIIKLDTLSILEEVLGESAFIYRELVYSVIAGTSQVNDLIASFYRRYPTFRTFVNEIFNYGNDAIPITDRVVTELRKRVFDYHNKMYSYLDNVGGKYLISTHEFMYFAFSSVPDITHIKGATIVC